jgi:hypothetical protein
MLLDGLRDAASAAFGSLLARHSIVGAAHLQGNALSPIPRGILMKRKFVYGAGDAAHAKLAASFGSPTPL